MNMSVICQNKMGLVTLPLFGRKVHQFSFTYVKNKKSWKCRYTPLVGGPQQVLNVWSGTLVELKSSSCPDNATGSAHKIPFTSV